MICRRSAQDAGERGRPERTREDLAEVGRRAGLTLTAVTPLAEAAPFAVIEAVAG